MYAQLLRLMRRSPTRRLCPTLLRRSPSSSSPSSGSWIAWRAWLLSDTVHTHPQPGAKCTPMAQATQRGRKEVEAASSQRTHSLPARLALWKSLPPDLPIRIQILPACTGLSKLTNPSRYVSQHTSVYQGAREKGQRKLDAKSSSDGRKRPIPARHLAPVTSTAHRRPHDLSFPRHGQLRGAGRVC